MSVLSLDVVSQQMGIQVNFVIVVERKLKRKF